MCLYVYVPFAIFSYFFIWRDAAKPAHRTGAANWRLGVPSKGFVFRILLSICMVIFISPVVFPSFCKLMGFSFHFFSSSNWLIDFLRFQIYLKWLISFRIIFPGLLATLQIAVYFNFINRLFFYMARCRKARPSDRGRELEARCAVQGLFL